MTLGDIPGYFTHYKLLNVISLAAFHHAAAIGM